MTSEAMKHTAYGVLSAICDGKEWAAGQLWTSGAKDAPSLELWYLAPEQGREAAQSVGDEDQQVKALRQNSNFVSGLVSETISSGEIASREGQDWCRSDAVVEKLRVPFERAIAVPLQMDASSTPRNVLVFFGSPDSRDSADQSTEALWQAVSVLLPTLERTRSELSSAGASLMTTAVDLDSVTVLHRSDWHPSLPLETMERWMRLVAGCIGAQRAELWLPRRSSTEAVAFEPLVGSLYPSIPSAEGSERRLWPDSPWSFSLHSALEVFGEAVQEASVHACHPSVLHGRIDEAVVEIDAIPCILPATTGNGGSASGGSAAASASSNTGDAAAGASGSKDLHVPGILLVYWRGVLPVSKKPNSVGALALLGSTALLQTGVSRTLPFHRVPAESLSGQLLAPCATQAVHGASVRRRKSGWAQLVAAYASLYEHIIAQQPGADDMATTTAGDTMAAAGLSALASMAPSSGGYPMGGQYMGSSGFGAHSGAYVASVDSAGNPVYAPMALTTGAEQLPGGTVLTVGPDGKFYSTDPSAAGGSSGFSIIPASATFPTSFAGASALGGAQPPVPRRGGRGGAAGGNGFAKKRGGGVSRPYVRRRQEGMSVSGRKPEDVVEVESWDLRTSRTIGERPPRRGKWVPGEDEYVDEVIDAFRKGLLPLPEGTTLRTLLAQQLHCLPMRITKKFTKDSSLKKQTYNRNPLHLPREEWQRHCDEALQRIHEKRNAMVQQIHERTHVHLDDLIEFGLGSAEYLALSPSAPPAEAIQRPEWMPQPLTLNDPATVVRMEDMLPEFVRYGRSGSRRFADEDYPPENWLPSSRAQSGSSNRGRKRSAAQAGIGQDEDPTAVPQGMPLVRYAAAADEGVPPQTMPDSFAVKDETEDDAQGGGWR